MVNNIFLLCIFGLVIFIIYSYNKAVSLRNYVNEAFSTMDVYLKKRWDLVPNLVSCVKAYATHEKDIFEHVAILRSSNYSTMSQKEKLNTNEQINNLLPQIIAIAENYPEIKANESFSKLMENLTSIEEDIANSRKYYNGTVRIFNNFLEIFPFNVIGKLFGFKTAEMFTISNDERNNIKVEF